MARRSAVRNGPGYAPGGGADTGTPGYSAPDPWDAPEPKGRGGKKNAARRDGGGRKGRGWGGSGGRWLVWLGRIVLWALIIVILVNGIRAPFQRFTDKPTTTTTGATGDGAQRPTTAVSAYALDFAGVYLNYDQATADQRRSQLAQFLAPGVDQQLGWDETGRSAMQFAQVYSVAFTDADHAIVTLLTRVNGRSFQLAVPVYTKDGAMAISGRPASLPLPPKATPPAAGVDRDAAVETELKDPLAGFFKAYGSNDATSLSRLADRPITGLGGALVFSQLKDVIAPHGAPASRTVTATVVWQVPPQQPKGSGGTLEQTYELTVVKKDSNWYVHDIRGSTRPAGS